MSKKIKPFIKWAGGKRQLLPEIKKRLPEDYKTYYEPFVGGGAVLFELQPKKAIINDLNYELINTYKTVKNNYKRLREYLMLMEYGHSETFFKKIRSIDKNIKNDNSLLNLGDTKELRASRFIYLNKAGFNGLYRVNKNGYFNVPSGKKQKVKTHEFPNLQMISEYFKESVHIRNVHFYTAVKDAKKGDFIYFDPPYDYETGINGFDSYQKGGFGTKGQIKLANLCKELDGKGVKFMVSNHNTKLIKNIFSDFNIDMIKARRLVGGKGASRQNVEEVLITNYEYKKNNKR